MNIRLILVLCLICVWPASAENTATIDKTGAYQRSGKIVGGELTDGRDIRNIRWAQQRGYERIVLDVYMGNYEGLGPAVPRACHFEVSYSPGNRILKVMVAGTRRFSARFPDTARSRLIRGFKRVPSYDDSSHTFQIQLSRSVEYEVFELRDPGRIVLDIRAR